MRVFVAISPSTEVRDRLDQLILELKGSIGSRSVRWVDSKGMHLTLKFYGEVPSQRVDGLSAILDVAAAGVVSFPMGIRGVGCFPNPRRPRVIWIGANDQTQTLAHIAKALEDRSADTGFRREERPFHPHLTLGRVRRGVARDELESISSNIQMNREKNLGEILVDHISLIESKLTPRGAIYTTLYKRELDRES